MALDLANLLQSQLGNTLNQFLTANGETVESSDKAAGLALPALMAGLLKHVTANPININSLTDLVNGPSGQALESAADSALSGGSFDSLLNLGKSLLPKLLDGNGASVAEEIAQQSGISKTSAGSLLSLGLPLVLSVLRKQNLNQSQLIGLLGQQDGWLSAALNSKLLAALGIGSLGSLTAKLSNLLSSLNTTGVAPATTAGGSGIGKWLALAAAVLVGIFAIKSCNAPSAPQAASGEAASAASAESNGAASDLAFPASTASAPASEPMAASADMASAAAPASAASAASGTAAAADDARVVYENATAKFYFATGKSDVPQGAESIVEEIITAGKDGKKLTVSGFTDSTGNAQANAELSKQRAEAVKAFLQLQGVSADNIELRKPENTTAASGDNAEGRRVEVKVAE